MCFALAVALAFAFAVALAFLSVIPAKESAVVFLPIPPHQPTPQKNSPQVKEPGHIHSSQRCAKWDFLRSQSPPAAKPIATVFYRNEHTR
jgi:hypothetical protein